MNKQNATQLIIEHYERILPRITKDMIPWIKKEDKSNILFLHNYINSAIIFIIYDFIVKKKATFIGREGKKATLTKAGQRRFIEMLVSYYYAGIIEDIINSFSNEVVPHKSVNYTICSIVLINLLEELELWDNSFEKAVQHLERILVKSLIKKFPELLSFFVHDKKLFLRVQPKFIDIVFNIGFIFAGKKVQEELKELQQEGYSLLQSTTHYLEKETAEDPRFKEEIVLDFTEAPAEV